MQKFEIIGLGPIAQAVRSLPFFHTVLISDYPQQEVQAYATWLQRLIKIPITQKSTVLTSPTNFSEIYKAATDVIKDSLATFGRDKRADVLPQPLHTCHGSSLDSAGKDTLPGNPIQSSKDHGVQIADISFDISSVFIPKISEQADKRLEEMISALPYEAPNSTISFIAAQLTPSYFIASLSVIFSQHEIYLHPVYHIISSSRSGHHSKHVFH